MSLNNSSGLFYSPYIPIMTYISGKFSNYMTKIHHFPILYDDNNFKSNSVVEQCKLLYEEVITEYEKYGEIYIKGSFPIHVLEVLSRADFITNYPNDIDIFIKCNDIKIFEKFPSKMITRHPAIHYFKHDKLGTINLILDNGELPPIDFTCCDLQLKLKNKGLILSGTEATAKHIEKKVLNYTPEYLNKPTEYRTLERQNKRIVKYLKKGYDFSMGFVNDYKKMFGLSINDLKKQFAEGKFPDNGENYE